MFVTAFGWRRSGYGVVAVESGSTKNSEWAAVVSAGFIAR
jgi:hypothetical protein